MQTIQVRRNANNNYQHSNGTDHYYKHWLGFHYTDGATQVAEDYGAYWFIDLIASHQCHAKVRKEEFQVWHLKRTKDDKFMAICEDGNNNRVTQQAIPFSDFKDDDLTMWLVNKVIMLPSEY